MIDFKQLTEEKLADAATALKAILDSPAGGVVLAQLDAIADGVVGAIADSRVEDIPALQGCLKSTRVFRETLVALASQAEETPDGKKKAEPLVRDIFKQSADVDL